MNKAVKTLHVSRIVHWIVQAASVYLNIKEYTFITSLLPIKIFTDKKTDFLPIEGLSLQY